MSMFRQKNWETKQGANQQPCPCDAPVAERINVHGPISL